MERSTIDMFAGLTDTFEGEWTWNSVIAVIAVIGLVDSSR